MPYSCFSYSSDVALGIGNRDAARSALGDLRKMPVWPCFSYSAHVPLRDVQRMQDKICFSYSTGLPLGVRNRNAAPRAVRDLRSKSRGWPSGCFSYLV
jgi:hypothetical protein